MPETKSQSRLAAETRIAQGLHYSDPETGAVMPPIHPATTFARDREHELVNPAHSYTRADNPTYALAEAMIAELELAEQALLFSSGMAAATAVFRALKHGDHVVVPEVMYWGLRHWLNAFEHDWGLQVSRFDARQPDSLAQAIRAGETRIVWIETPCNPLWDVTDIRAAAELAHAAGAQLAVDSTVATPVHTQPLALGADIVMHSATKSLNGHSDVLAGALACRQRNALWQRIVRQRGEDGAIPSAFDAWLLQRGLRTLFVRVREASANAARIASHFEGHPKVAQVLYPGLPSSAGYEIACAQMQGGFGAMLSLCVHGDRRTAIAVAGRCNVFTRATSLGGVESLVEHRASIEGEDSPVPGNLLRFSIGIERVDDLIADIEQALQAVELTDT
ncbi:MAG: PLP-dependent aspartate aminotransferase family protein [Pseudomonadota bacterium]